MAVSRVLKLVRTALAVPVALAATAAMGSEAPDGGFELTALLAAATQCQLVEEGADADDECSGVVLAQPELAYHSTDLSLIHI